MFSFYVINWCYLGKSYFCNDTNQGDANEICPSDSGESTFDGAVDIIRNNYLNLGINLNLTVIVMERRVNNEGTTPGSPGQ